MRIVFTLPEHQSIYYKIKELLLRKNIPSQTIDASKVTENTNFQYSLTNIAVKSKEVNVKPHSVARWLAANVADG